ncbi:hypothetical protein L1887_44288 [Cichorium endivia]|nr:hypothetical protein L1887_44288 [Cichorium endivia]
MLRACIIDFGGSWEDHLPLVEFAYNNTYHSSIQMAPFEALYGAPCRTPTCWTETGDKPLAGPEIIAETEEKIQSIREHMRVAQNRQKQYADRRRKPLEFSEGDMVMLKVSPWKGVIRFGKRGKLSPRFIGPFRVLKKIGAVAYKLELPEELRGIHNVFHVSHLRKTLHDQSTRIPLAGVQLDEKLRYQEMPEQILEKKVKKLRNKEVGLVKVQWRHHKGTDVTWEAEGEMRMKYPYLFQEISRTESFEGVEKPGPCSRNPDRVLSSEANRRFNVEKPGPCFINRSKQRISLWNNPGRVGPTRAVLRAQISKARQEHGIRSSGVSQGDPTSGVGSGDRGKRVSEG